MNSFICGVSSFYKLQKVACFCWSSSVSASLLRILKINSENSSNNVQKNFDRFACYMPSSCSCSLPFAHSKVCATERLAGTHKSIRFRILCNQKHSFHASFKFLSSMISILCVRKFYEYMQHFCFEFI